MAARKKNDDSVNENTYVINGNHYTRVTRILQVIHNEGIANWKGKQAPGEADRIRDEAGKFGTRVHTVVEGINLNPDTYRNQDPELDEWYDAYKNWYDEFVYETVASEIRIQSDQHRYAGKFDGLLRLQPNKKIPTGKGNFFETPSYPMLVMIDAKTNRSAVSATTRLQLCGYIEGGREMGEDWADEVEGRLAIWLPSSQPGYILPIFYDNPQGDQDSWEAARILFRWNELHKNDWKQYKF